MRRSLILLLGLDKEDMDEKADHFPSYEKWTHLTLTEDQDDLVVLFQRIIEIMQQIVNSRTIKLAAQQRRSPVKGPKPKPKPKTYAMKKQQCIEMSSGDELEVTTKSNGEQGHGGKTQTTKSPGQQSENVPGGKSENQLDKTKTVSSRDTSLGSAGGFGNLSINITPSTPHNEVASVQFEETNDGDVVEEDSVYSRDLTFVKGSALLKAEVPSDNGNGEPIQTNCGITVQPFAKASVRRDTDTDEAIYENSQVQNSTGQTKASDLNGNLVTSTQSVMSTTDSPAEDFDDIDGPSTFLSGRSSPHHGAHRPRSGRVSEKDGKKFHKRSAALRFNLSPTVIDGDVSICIGHRRINSFVTEPLAVFSLLVNDNLGVIN